MIQRDYEIFLLALTAWREARGESEDGINAVLHVIRNRVNIWHKSWFDVITGHNQFSSISVLCDPQTVLWPRPGDVVFGKIQSMAAVVWNGAGDDPTDGAVYYRNSKTATSGWFQTNIADKKTFSCTIGLHDFWLDRDRPV